MEVVHERCCGLDIHKKLIVACAIVPGSSGQARKQVRTFGTMSDDLQQLSDWLTEQGVTHAANRLQKVLEGANVKLASVASDILGRSGREMLEALVAGETSTAAMAELARGRMRDKRPTLERALAGRFGPHQRFLVAEVLAH